MLVLDTIQLKNCWGLSTGRQVEQCPVKFCKENRLSEDREVLLKSFALKLVSVVPSKRVR